MHKNGLDGMKFIILYVLKSRMKFENRCRVTVFLMTVLSFYGSLSRKIQKMAELSSSVSSDTLGTLSIPEEIETNVIIPPVEEPLTAVPNPPATSPSSYLGNTNLFMDNKDFFMLLQDRGELNIDKVTNRPFLRKPRKRHYDKNTDRLYKDIYVIGFTLYNLYKKFLDVFVKFGQPVLYATR